MKSKTKRKKKQKDETPTQVRDVTKQTACLHCKGKFWAPSGKRMCPWCGKHMIVIDGVQGNMDGFFLRLLEGIGASGGISDIEVHRPTEPLKTPSDSRETEGEK